MQNVSANIHVAGPNTRVQVSSAEMAGARFAASQIALGTGARVADVQFDAQTGAAQLLDFLRNTPLDRPLPLSEMIGRRMAMCVCRAA